MKLGLGLYCVGSIAEMTECDIYEATEFYSRQKRIAYVHLPLAHFGQPEDIGWAAAYLCSPAARFVTGTCLVVDGGISIGF